jgi:hypothetical protein
VKLQKFKLIPNALNDFELSQQGFFTIVLHPGGKNQTLFSLSFCLDTKERKNQGSEFLFCSQIILQL